jgi:hypothetical protein
VSQSGVDIVFHVVFALDDHPSWQISSSIEIHREFLIDLQVLLPGTAVIA